MGHGHLLFALQPFQLHSVPPLLLPPKSIPGPDHSFESPNQNMYDCLFVISVCLSQNPLNSIHSQLIQGPSLGTWSDSSAPVSGNGLAIHQVGKPAARGRPPSLQQPVPRLSDPSTPPLHGCLTPAPLLSFVWAHGLDSPDWPPCFPFASLQSPTLPAASDLLKITV